MKDFENKEATTAVADEVTVKGKHRRWDFVVALVCILLAFLVWLCIMNVRDTEYIGIELVGTQEGYTYQLSVTSLELEGKRALLKSDEAVIYVDVSELNYEKLGEQSINSDCIKVPEGLSLMKASQLTVTITAE